MDKIQYLVKILSSEYLLNEILSEELKKLNTAFADSRRSEIVYDAQNVNQEDLITPQDMVVIVSHTGYIKAQPLSDYRAQKRGGRGKMSTSTKDEDFVEQMFIANTHDTILCFSTRGRCYWLKVYEVPQGSRIARGKPIVNFFKLEPTEKISAILPVKNFTDDSFIFMATSHGTVKKIPLSDLANPRKNGVIAIGLNGDDHMVRAAITDGKSSVMLFSDAGKVVHFSETDVREMGRQARGVRGISLEKGQKVITMLVANSDPCSVLTVTQNGYGKRTALKEYTKHARGTKGMISINQSERNGRVISATLVYPDDEVVLVSEMGVLIRVRSTEIREMGRATQGVVLINLDNKDRLAIVQKVAESLLAEEE